MVLIYRRCLLSIISEILNINGDQNASGTEGTLNVHNNAGKEANGDNCPSRPS